MNVQIQQPSRPHSPLFSPQCTGGQKTYVCLRSTGGKKASPEGTLCIRETEQKHPSTNTKRVIVSAAASHSDQVISYLICAQTHKFSHAQTHAYGDVPQLTPGEPDKLP